MKLLDYLFYKVYKLINYLGNDDFYPEANAWFISTTFLWLNFLTLLNVAEINLEKSLTQTWGVVVFYILFLVATYIFFFRKERYKKILEIYKGQTGINRKWGTILILVYIAATIALHFYFSEKRRSISYILD